MRFWVCREQVKLDFIDPHLIAGTSRDVSFLIDFLPSYLYPSGERTISQWFVGGMSLGGHTAWYTLRHGTVLPDKEAPWTLFH